MLEIDKHEKRAFDINRVRVIVDLPLGTLEILRELAVSQRISLTEAMRRAVATSGLMQRRIQASSRILVEDVDGQLDLFLFPWCPCAAIAAQPDGARQ